MDEFIEELSKCIGLQWKHLARKLNFTTTDIDALSHDNQLDLREQIFQFFDKWKQTEGNGASVQKLVDGLQAAKLTEQLQSLTAKNLICKGDDGKFYERNEYVRSKRLQRLMSSSSDGPTSPSSSSSVPDSQPLTPVTSTDSASTVERDSPAKSSLASPKVTHVSVGDMVMVEQKHSPWYGVVRWIGKLAGNDKTIYGVEMEDVMEGGTSGLCIADQIQHFKCEEGHALYLPLHLLKPDGRFLDAQRDGPYRRSTQPPQPQPSPPSTASSPASASASDPPLKVEPPQPQFPDLLELFRNIGTGNPCGSESQPAATNSEVQSRVLVFQIPKDTAGIVIGREGKNITEIERETNTSIQIERGFSLAGNSKGIIRGSEENCKKAIVLIAETIERRQKQHMAHVRVKEISNAGRVIGRDGSTRRAIETLSGARLKIEEKPLELGLGYLGIGPTQTCKITGSDEAITAAERLIDRAQAGEDIHAQATFMSMATAIARLMRLGFEFEGT